MTDYPPNEIDVIKILSEARNNYTIAERIYVETFPGRCHLNRMVIKKLCERTRQDLNETTSLTVLGTIFLNPQVSTRQIEKKQGISTANRVLKAYKFHPYYIHLIQQLKEGNFQSRLRFCNWTRDQESEKILDYFLKFFFQTKHSITMMLINTTAIIIIQSLIHIWQRSQEFQRQ